MSIFQNVFQGGAVVEVFSPVDDKLCSNTFISKNAKKMYDKLAKTYVYVMAGESTEKLLAMPKNPKRSSLGLLQPHLVLQLFRSGDKGFRFEIGVSCANGYRKRITFSSHKTYLQVSTLSALVPFKLHHKSSWMHLCFSIHDLVSALWNEQCHSIHSISLGGNFSIRKIYTMHKDIISDGYWTKAHMLNLPKQSHFPMNVSQAYHLIAKDFLSANNNCNPVKQNHVKDDPIGSYSSSARKLRGNATNKDTIKVCSSSSEGALGRNQSRKQASRACSSFEGIVQGIRSRLVPIRSLSSAGSAEYMLHNTQQIQSNLTEVDYGISSSGNCGDDAKHAEFNEFLLSDCPSVPSISSLRQAQKGMDEMMNQKITSHRLEMPSTYGATQCNVMNETFSLMKLKDNLSKLPRDQLLNVQDSNQCLNLDAEDRLYEIQNHLHAVQNQPNNTGDGAADMQNELSENEDELLDNKHLEVWLPSTSMDLSDALSLARNLTKT